MHISNKKSFQAKLKKNVDHSQKNQIERMKQGVKDGSLTKAEYTKLAGQQAKIALAKGEALSDGKLTAKEYKELKKMQAEASRDIFQARHNKAKGPSLGNDFAPLPKDVQQKIEDQAKLIGQGVKDGSLTDAEARVLIERMAANGYDNAQAASDGRLTKPELTTVRREQQELDQLIRSYMTNSRTA
ncbi:MAG: hypothetical protein ACOZIN_11730 [Myxococcota bacterium]